MGADCIVSRMRSSSADMSSGINYSVVHENAITIKLSESMYHSMKISRLCLVTFESDQKTLFPKILSHIVYGIVCYKIANNSM